MEHEHLKPLLNQAAGWLGETAYEHDERAKIESDEAEASFLRATAEQYRAAADLIRSTFGIENEA